MLSCKETSLLVSQSLDRGLSWRERWAVRLHLLLCAACLQFKRQVEFLRTAAQRGAESLLGLSPTARDRIQHALHRHEQ